MKKIFCIIMALICITAASACAERHIGIQGCFPASPENGTFTISMYRNGGRQTILSSLFPQFSVKNEDTEDPEVLDPACLLFSVRAETIAFMDDSLEKLLKQWIDSQADRTETGTYAGALFLSASGMSACSFSLSGLRQFMDLQKDSIPTDNAQQDFLHMLTSAACRFLQQASGCEDPVIRVRCYDGGKYYSILIENGEETMMSVSVDLSAEAEKRLLVTTREESLYSHRLLRYVPAVDVLNVSYGIWTGPSSVFPGENTMPDCSWQAELRDDGEKETGFKAEFTAASLALPLEAKGRIVTQDDDKRNISATIRITGDEKNMLEIDAVMDSASDIEEATGLTEMNMKNEADLSMIRLTLYTAELQIFADVLPMLPTDYQQLIWNLMTIM